jgi:hypothetical protein
MAKTCSHCGIELTERYTVVVLHTLGQTGRESGTLCADCDDEIRTWLAAGAARIREDQSGSGSPSP